MKLFRIFLIISVLPAFVINFACKQPAKKPIKKEKVLSAVEYNNVIVSQQEIVLSALTDYSQIYETNASREQANLFEEVAYKSIDTAIFKIKKIRDFQGDSTFQVASLKWLKFYRALMDKEYKEIREIAEKNAKITKNDLKRVNEIHADITKREKPILNSFAKAQREFAKKNNIVLPKTK